MVDDCYYFPPLIFLASTTPNVLVMNRFVETPSIIESPSSLGVCISFCSLYYIHCCWYYTRLVLFLIFLHPCYAPSILVASYASFFSIFVPHWRYALARSEESTTHAHVIKKTRGKSDADWLLTYGYIYMRESPPFLFIPETEFWPADMANRD